MLHVDPDRRFAEDLTKQELYDLAVYHLGTMPERSSNIDGTCVYRHRHSGNSCAVGYFLKDDEVPVGCNSKGVSDLASEGKLPHRLLPHIEVLCGLQAFHDRPENWMCNRTGLKVMLRDRMRHYLLDTSMIDHPDMAWNKKPSVLDRIWI